MAEDSNDAAGSDNAHSTVTSPSSAEMVEKRTITVTGLRQIGSQDRQMVVVVVEVAKAKEEVEEEVGDAAFNTASSDAGEGTEMAVDGDRVDGVDRADRVDGITGTAMRILIPPPLPLLLQVRFRHHSLLHQMLRHKAVQ